MRGVFEARVTSVSKLPGGARDVIPTCLASRDVTSRGLVQQFAFPPDVRA